MIKLLIILIFILILFIFLECFIKEKYFTSENRTNYYKVLKNILNILVSIFIILDRKDIITINVLGPLVIIYSVGILLYNAYLCFVNINILKKQSLL